jgi:type II protein arginine methyltransferase
LIPGPDVQVSELLGSFGDNELSPECIDGAQHALVDGGICIPSSYTSYLAPVSTHVIHTSLLSMEKPERLEMPMVVKLARHVVLSPPLPLFTFNHPNRCGAK